MTLGKSAGRVVVAATIACALALGGCATESGVTEGAGASPVRIAAADPLELAPREAVTPADSLRLPDETIATAEPADWEPVAPADADQDALLASVQESPQSVLDEMFGNETEPGGGLIVPWGPKTSVDKQMHYMFATWNNYNVAGYGDFNPMGGDCMNFVSQSLVERGWLMQPGWYNNVASGGGWTAPFVHVPSFDTWLRAHPGSSTPFATELSFAQKAQVKVGDVVVFDWDPAGGNGLDHAMAVSEIRIVDGVRRIFLIGHNNDVSHRDFDGVIAGTGATGHFWSIP